ncbi:alpha/beta fold hydrolase [Ponticoccus sp. SC2-23]|uniref:alpha/beta fold hydrolase n=1 Tax=Alexandriicola marinus TaxID=2081710 RepID=UPI000FD99B7D|nr:alpha/beta fold hydrolase [Alexandriicola marinus]MBM1219162.1 alpha/beta fold hydrolase [Ponticoccus sp. SC6-9]MBM1223766.1 alpha/beta fold hydrolase [Ponticoccus sp. SC6-15]MBM1228976.1 alpha/beta fold hydrolase [Ponticoccus sp. SC6-38]MBM1232732.1 alpha/beta fold hydrolase [Ponticoccus sp. SC6-45]MBM1237318.1 alpha/beta fold hydrolase [Ponticoccus sp. SC6-49]MBM1241743.1 alpha/beta fold hydrolase [Ponticoccus sp. SC2-64]MBM1246256.1 alpha/beta fold hydrolase [Ponticoccus sp. SC6-42]MB
MTAPIWIEREGYRLASYVSGQYSDAPTIVLSNSLGADYTMWDEQLALLEPHYRVIRYDTRGHGGSDPAEGPYSFDGLVADVIGVLDTHGVDRADFMGLSLGCMTGLGVALAHGDRIGRMICAAGRADAPEPFVQNWDNRLRILAEDGLEGLWAMTQGMWFTEGFREAEPGRVERFREAFMRTSSNGYAGCCEALKTLDYLRHLGGVSTPTLFIAGEKDIGAAPDVMRGMAQTTPGSRFVEVPDAGHIVNAGQPALYNAAVAEFLEITT